jgi:hypothetical protein
MLRPHGLRTLGYVSLSPSPIEARDPEQPVQAPIDAPDDTNGQLLPPQHHLISMAVLADTPSQVTVTWPVPGRVLEPITHSQEMEPSLPAVLGVRPWAVLRLPAGVT